jgi:tetratricopeptide (TPR) repeat protein
MAPTSNFFLLIGSMMAERFMYLPSLALCGCVVVALQEIGGRPWLKWAAVGAVCLGFGLRTYARNFDWQDSVTLWSSAVEAYPECAQAHNNLGVALGKQSDLPGAIAQFEAALRIFPAYAVAHISMGNELARIPGREPDAIAQFQAALQIDPGIAAAHYNLGNLLARMPERAPDAIAEWQAAIRLDPISPSRTTIWVPRMPSLAADPRTRSPSIRPRYASVPVTRKRTTIWAACTPGFRTDSPKPSPHTSPRCAFVPILWRLTTTLPPR